MRHLIFAALATLALTAPVRAQESEALVRASDPGSIMKAFAKIGLQPELGKDGVGDPLIIARGTDGVLSVIFFGCDEATKDNCDTIRVQIGMDRAEPWNAQEAMSLSEEFPFLAVRLDEEGDPFVHWDLYLGEGIGYEVFISNLRRFIGSAGEAAKIVFAEELATPDRQ